MSHTNPTRARHKQSAQEVDRHIATYDEFANGTTRELVLLAAAAGSRLLVDRRASDLSDARVVAHLAADEPDSNAELVSRLFLADQRRACRPLTDADLRTSPLADMALSGPGGRYRGVLTDRHGCLYRIAVLGPSNELRWLREPPAGTDGSVQRVSLRCVVGAVEDYGTVRETTLATIAEFRRDTAVSTATLGLELRRLDSSPIVLNRGLRQAVLDAIARGTSLSAIAIACGRIKRDPRGRPSGETSWLGRRVGLLGATADAPPNPWIHSDVLGLIAREGLGLAPHEVELA